MTSKGPVLGSFKESTDPRYVINSPSKICKRQMQNYFFGKAQNLAPLDIKVYLGITMFPLPTTDLSTFPLRNHRLGISDSGLEPTFIHYNNLNSQ